jgi:hypothetical protein
MLVPSAMPRSTCTPDTRASDSATLRSGSLPMSSATIASTNCVASRLMSRALLRLSRMPVTMTSSTVSPAGAVVCACTDVASSVAGLSTEYTTPRTIRFVRMFVMTCSPPGRLVVMVILI